MWSHNDILEAAAGHLRDAADRLDAEQAVRGLDALEELDLHALLAAGLAASAHPDAPWGVLREQHYPGDRTPSHAPAAQQCPRPPDEDDRPRLDPLDASEGAPIFEIAGPLARESDRQRCDLVLTPGPGLTIADPVRKAKKARARRQEAAGSLFEAHAAAETLADAAAPDPAAIPPEDAFWLEVKLVGQYCFEAGVPGPNRTYGSQLVRGAAADLAKLAKDPHIHHAALLIVLFTQTPEVAEHDLVAAMHRCLDRGVAASTPLTASFPITDRIGNETCTLALIRASR